MGRKTFRKVITNDSLKAQINPKNIQLMEKFLKNFATKRSPKSVVVYRSNLTIFFTWNLLENENQFFIDIKKYSFMDFFDYCVTELKWSPNRYAECHSTLSSFSTWIENIYDERYPNFRNVMAKIEKPAKENVRKKSVFTKIEMDKLMKYLEDEGKIREQCLLATMMASGARLSELCRFTTTMIDEKNVVFDGLFLETTEEMQVKGRGVNGKKILRYLVKDMFLPYYKKYLPIRKQIMKENNKKHDYLFVKQNGDPATPSAINSWIEDWSEVLGKPFYAHCVRHFNTSYLLKAGLDAELIQLMQDWQSSEMVSIYNDNSMTDRRWKGLAKLKEALNKDGVTDK